MNNVEFLPSVKGNNEDVLVYNRANGWPDLPAQAKVFAHEYAVVGNLSAACKTVHIGSAKGSRLLRDPLVAAYLVDLNEHLTQDTLFRREFVELEMLKTLEQVDGQVDVPNVTKDGDIVMGPRFNASAKIALLKEMQKLAGMAKEQGVDGHGVTVQINLEGAGYDPAHDRTVVAIDGVPIDGSNSST